MQSRLRQKFGDTCIVSLGRVRLSLDFRAMHDVRMYWSIARHGGYEPETGRLLGRLLKPGDTFVDIGANNGYFAVLASQFVGPSGSVLAIEPNPGAVERLTRNVALNGLEGTVRILPIALGEREGRGNLNVSSFEDGWATLGPFPGPKTTVPVQIRALDDILEPTGPVVMKIDAEGTEPSILRGMSRLVDRAPGLAILLEWNHLFGDEALWNYLNARFRVYEIVAQTGGEVGLEQVHSFERLRHTFLKNILITTGTRWSTDKPSA